MIFTCLSLISRLVTARSAPDPAGHGFAGELCRLSSFGPTLHVFALKPIALSFDLLIVTKYVSWKFHPLVHGFGVLSV